MSNQQSSGFMTSGKDKPNAHSTHPVEAPQMVLDKLAKVGTPTITGQLQRHGLRNTYLIGINPLALRPGQVMVGRAKTLRFVRLREDLVEQQYSSLTASPHRSALETIGPSEVLVVDTYGCLAAAIAGDVFTRRIKMRGATGLVVDGVVRDLGAIKTIGLPVFGRGQHGAGIPAALMSVGIDEPVQVGGVPVFPGDILVGDEDGVVVVPAYLAQEVADEGYEHVVMERWIRMKIAGGSSLHEVYPPNERHMVEYKEWRKSQPE